MRIMRSVAIGLMLAALCCGQEGHGSLYLALHPVPRSKQRVARAAARSPGQSALAGHREGA